MNKVLRSLLVLGLSAVTIWLVFLMLAPARSPEITLMSIDGEQIALADFRGRPLLVTFWATTCGSCMRELPHLVELHRELAPRGLQVIGIAMSHDPPNRVLELRNARAIPWPIALDIHAQAAQAFGDVRLTPTSFLIAPDGRIVYRNTGELDMARLRADIIALLPDTSTAADCEQKEIDSTCSG